MRPVLCKINAMEKQAVLLQSQILTSYRRNQIVGVIESYSFATNVKRRFQVYIKVYSRIRLSINSFIAKCIYITLTLMLTLTI